MRSPIFHALCYMLIAVTNQSGGWRHDNYSLCYKADLDKHKKSGIITLLSCYSDSLIARL